jgi:general stress protein 26
VTSSVDSLSALLSAFDCAMLTIIDGQGRPRTRPMRSLKAPFNGHVWFRLDQDTTPADEIGRGAQASVAYGGSANGPYVTLYGWAIVLRDPVPVRPVWRPAGVSKPTGADRLICVSARAAEVWDAASTASRRVFTFADAQPVVEERKLPQERALAPRLVAISTMPCAS